MMDEAIDVQAELEVIRSGGEAPAPEPTPAPVSTEDDTQEEEANPTPQAPADPQSPTQQDGKEWNPEGPGDRRVALKHAREALSIAKQAEERARQEAETLRAQLAAIENAKREAAERERLQLEVDQMDPDDVPAYLESLRKQDAEQIASTYEQRLLQERAAHSVELMRETFSDFDAQLAKLQSDPTVNWAYFDQQPNPAKAAYDYAKSRPSQEEIEAQLEERLQARLAEVLPKTQPQAPRAPRGVNSIPASATAAATPRDPINDVSVDDIGKMTAEERREWMNKALTQGH